MRRVNTNGEVALFKMTPSKMLIRIGNESNLVMECKFLRIKVICLLVKNIY